MEPSGPVKVFNGIALPVPLPVLNPLTPELIPPRNAACRDFLLWILIFKGLTARCLYKSYGVNWLTSLTS
jgi:hypothetical protein